MNNEIIIKRLSLIKYLYLQGVEQSHQAELVAGYSILAFHDSIEMFLMLACEHRDASKDNKKMMMMDYLGILSDVQMKESMKSLNECRISIKHHGQFPSKTDIEKHRMNAGMFLNINCKIIFDIDFDTVSLVDLVSYSEAHNYLANAEADINSGKLYDSLVNSRLAFEFLLREYETSKKYWYHSIYKFGKRIDNSYQHLLTAVFDKKKQGKDKWFKEVSETLTSIQNVLHLTSMGIDYGKFALFDAITPKCTWMMDGTYNISGCEDYMKDHIFLTEETCRMCISFVIDTAIKFQDSEFDTSKYLKHTKLE